MKLLNLFVLGVLLFSLFGCDKKPAEKTSQTETQPAVVSVPPKEPALREDASGPKTDAKNAADKPARAKPEHGSSGTQGKISPAVNVVPEKPSATPKIDAKIKPGKVFKDCPDCPEMVVIPAGSFDMGSANPGEKPAHSVTIGRAFAMGRTEVTQGQWKAVMGNNPSSFKSCGDNCPVEMVNWDDIQKFIQKLNAKTGKQYRLPSEAEWEYSCRAGGKHEYCGSDNVDSVAWFSSSPGSWSGSYSDGSGIHPVASKQVNAFGLYDMSGNVWEWVEDSFNGSYNYEGAPSDGSAWQNDGAKRVQRGGSWYDGAEESRAARRVSSEPAAPGAGFTGFRLARVLP